MSKNKILHSEKLQTVHLILEGKESLRHIRNPPCCHTTMDKHL